MQIVETHKQIWYKFQDKELKGTLIFEHPYPDYTEKVDKILNETILKLKEVIDDIERNKTKS